MLGLGEGGVEVISPWFWALPIQDSFFSSSLSHFIHNLIAATSQAEEHLETGKSVFVMSQS